MSIFRKRSCAWEFFLSIAVWGIGTGCWMAVLNNYLYEIHGMNELSRGSLEFFREMPGLLLVFILALLNRCSDWKIMRLGIFVTLLGSLFLLCPVGRFPACCAIVVFSLGEHLALPVRSAISMRVSERGNEGRSLGVLACITNVGSVIGSLLAALLFWQIPNLIPGIARSRIYDGVWVLIALLAGISFLFTFSRNAPRDTTRRPRLYFSKKFRIYYLLELFYGARKQIFLTFAPFVLIKNYGLETRNIAVLLGICGLVNIFVSPLLGKLTDRLGYRFIMVWDTVVLFFVCLLYGFAGDLFSPAAALCVVCINYVLDAAISNTSLAASVYVKSLTASQEEITSTLSTGISINHLISVLAAPVGGWIWMKYGVGVLFSIAAVMSLANTLCAMQIPKEKQP